MEEYIKKSDVLELLANMPSDIVYDHIYELKGVFIGVDMPEEKETTNEIVYLCDRDACDGCPNFECKHTYDISHAINFEEVEPGKYMEKGITK